MSVNLGRQGPFWDGPAVLYPLRCPVARLWDGGGRLGTAGATTAAAVCIVAEPLSHDDGTHPTCTTTPKVRGNDDGR
jgi:hypothetical protein